MDKLDTHTHKKKFYTSICPFRDDFSLKNQYHTVLIKLIPHSGIKS